MLSDLGNLRVRVERRLKIKNAVEVGDIDHLRTLC